VLSAPGSRPAWAWFDRLTPAAAWISVVATASGLAAATEAGSRVAVVAALAGAVAPLSLLLLMVVRRRSLAERAWDGGQVLVADPSSASSDARGAEAGPPSRWRVVAALGRVEARELACSPWLAIGIGFQLFVLLSFAVIYVREDHSLWAEVTQQLLFLCHPMVGMSVVGAHAATTRARHDGAEELFVSCPADTSTRTLALLPPPNASPTWWPARQPTRPAPMPAPPSAPAPTSATASCATGWPPRWRPWPPRCPSGAR